MNHKMTSATLFLVLLIHASFMPETHQLPLTDRQDRPEVCYDPLHHLIPENRCAFDRRPVFVMRDGCPATSVCPLDPELSACPQPFQDESSQACPAETPVRLFEYSPREFLCPQQRCVSLACFADFCRARRSGRIDWQPLMMRRGSCDYLQCGCPATEANLLAEGCPGELLVLTVDSRSGCPVKLCTKQLPDSVNPLLPTLATTHRPVECPSRIACPMNTSELTVPNSEPGGCPQRICLLPELIGSGTVANYSSTNGSQTNATTAPRLNSTVTFETEMPVLSTSTGTPMLNGTTESIASTGEQGITTALPWEASTPMATAKLLTTAQMSENSTAMTDMNMTGGATTPAA